MDHGRPVVPHLDPHSVVSRGWFLSAPNAVLGVQVAVAAAALFLLVQVVRWYLQATPANPFADDDRRDRGEYLADRKKREAVLKRDFKEEDVPQDLDAIVVGSGIGGLTTAALLAKSGRRVLVLERHDQAGGCCHTFTDKGYEFDVGIHYVGADVARDGGLGKFLLDQVSAGQIQFAQMEDYFDLLSVGGGVAPRRFPVPTGHRKWRAELEETFPDEIPAIGKFFGLLEETKNAAFVLVLLKVLPLWLSGLLVKTGLLHLFTGLWRGKFLKSTQELIADLTEDKDLRTVFSYIWLAYGTPPGRSHFLMHSLILRHYSKGAFYPVGGASEIALNIIPVIERSGGRVMANAAVEEILHNGKKVMGVVVKKGSRRYRIEAPMVVSSVGIKNTFQKLLPDRVARDSYYFDLCSQFKSGATLMTVFLGLDASNEELKLPRQHVWSFASNDSGALLEKQLEASEMTEEEVMTSEVPGLYISFPSAKDSNWSSSRPGRESKSTCVLLALSNWSWYAQFAHTKLSNRGDKYVEMKDAVGQVLIDRACDLFPQIRSHIDYVEVGTPLTNQHYLGQPNGEVYGLDHERFDPLVVAKLRPKTDVEGLYLTGQDVLTSGFAGALYSGLLTAGIILGRNLFTDLNRLFKATKQAAKNNKKKDE